MNEKDFIPVEVTRSFLGIKKGTTLKYDNHSSKYISISAEEDISDGEYYYSGHAIQIDPVLIFNNIDKYFKPLELPITEENKAVEEFGGFTEDEVEKEKVIQGKLSEKLETILKESKKEEESKEAPIIIEEEKERGEGEHDVPESEYVPLKMDLVYECGLCHFVNRIATIKHGLFFPANEETRLKLTCENCGIVTDIHYLPIEEYESENDVKEESTEK